MSQNELSARIAGFMAIAGTLSAVIFWIMTDVSSHSQQYGPPQLLNDPSALSGFAWVCSAIAVTGILGWVIVAAQPARPAGQGAQPAEPAVHPATQAEIEAGADTARSWVKRNTRDYASPLSVLIAEYDGQDGNGMLRYRVHYRTVSGNTRTRCTIVTPGQ
jgi:hypothetical protein